MTCSEKTSRRRLKETEACIATHKQFILDFASYPALAAIALKSLVILEEVLVTMQRASENSALSLADRYETLSAQPSPSLTPLLAEQEPNA